MPSVWSLLYGRRAGWVALAVYMAIALACYWQVLNAFFLSDDFILLSAVKHGGPFIPWPIGSAQFVRPVPMLWLWTGLKLFGVRPLGFHLFNLLLLALDGVLIRAFVIEWFRPDSDQSESGTNFIAFFAGLLFVVWPTHPEAVSWISACIDGLATFFSLIALWMILRGFSNAKVWWIALSIGALIMALLSKESAFATVLVLWLVILIKRKNLNSSAKAPQSKLSWYLGLIGTPIALFGYLLLRHYLIGAWIGGYGAAHLRVNHPDLVNKIYLNASNAFVPLGPTLGAVTGSSAIKSLTFRLFLLAGVLIAVRLPRRERDWRLAVSGVAIVVLLWSANIARNLLFGDIFPIAALLAIEVLILALGLRRPMLGRVLGGWFGSAMITLGALFLFDYMLLPRWQETIADLGLLAAILWSWWASMPPRATGRSQRLWIGFTLCSIAFGFLALAPGVTLSINVLGESSRFAFYASAFGALALAGIWRICGLSSTRLGQLAAALVTIAFAVLLFHSNEAWGDAGNISREFAERLRTLQPVRRVYAIVIPDSIGNAFVFRGGFDKVPGLLGCPQTKVRYCFRALYLERGDRVETERIAAQQFEIHTVIAPARRQAWASFVPTDVGDVREWYSFSAREGYVVVQLAGWQPGDKVLAFDGAVWRILL